MQHLRTDRQYLTVGQKFTVAARQEWKCQMCKNTLSENIVFDHQIPLFEGGSNHISNFAALCPNCDAQKTKLDKQRYHDLVRQEKSGQSKYFDYKSPDCVLNNCPKLEAFFQQFRHRRKNLKQKHES